MLVIFGEGLTKKFNSAHQFAQQTPFKFSLSISTSNHSSQKCSHYSTKSLANSQQPFWFAPKFPSRSQSLALTSVSRCQGRAPCV